MTYLIILALLDAPGDYVIRRLSPSASLLICFPFCHISTPPVSTPPALDTHRTETLAGRNVGGPPPVTIHSKPHELLWYVNGHSPRS